MGRRAGAVAKSLGRASQSRHTAKGPSGDSLAYAGYYNFDDGRCFFCRRKKRGMRTAYLTVTGKVWWCGKEKCNKDRLEQEKLYEKTL
jgi:hypothetical protein